MIVWIVTPFLRAIHIIAHPVKKLMTFFLSGKVQKLDYSFVR